MSNNSQTCEIKEIEPLDVERFQDTSRILNVLGNKTRLAILAVMDRYDEACACELQPALELPQPTITSHLRKMYDIGILERKEIWKYSYYFISSRYRSLISDILKNQVKSISTSQRNE